MAGTGGDDRLSPRSLGERLLMTDRLIEIATD